MEKKNLGLTQQEVNKKISLGLSNSVIDSYSPTLSKILLKNVLSVINLVITPLLIFMGIFGLYMELTAFGMFIVINTLVSIFDEIRIKKEIEKLKKRFSLKVTVIRDNKKEIIELNKVVLNDVIISKEGELIVADGLIVKEEYLQIDESALTGETEYIPKKKGDKILSGSIVITGICYYEVSAIGESNMINKIATSATKIVVNKSVLQKNADKLIFFLILTSISLGFFNYILTSGNANITPKDQLLSVTTITSLIIPQTLIFLFTLTFSISISKLFKKGVLVQKGSAIENLSHVDLMCFDKTGTITTNQMFINKVEYTSKDHLPVFGQILNSCKDKIFGINKTSATIIDHFKNSPQVNFKDLTQIPFTSKLKFSALGVNIKNKYYQIFLGAFEALKGRIDEKTLQIVNNFINSNSAENYRIVIGICYEFDNNINIDHNNEKSTDIMVFFIEEELNFGIKELFERFYSQGISIKIISGDNSLSVGKITEKVGLVDKKIYDLSINKSHNFKKIVKEFDIFTRATPQDKQGIINALKKNGYIVAMVGDGVNDCLGLKAANVSIAMENGASVTRDISDIILLKNDYKKLPEVFYEGENIIFNLKLATKLFLTKSLFALLLGLFFSLNNNVIPLHPSSTLLFSFLGSSLPSYILIFSRTKITNGKNFFRDIFSSSIPASIIIFLCVIYTYYFLKSSGLENNILNTSLVLLILILSLFYSIIELIISKRLYSFKGFSLGFIIAFIIGYLQTFLPLESDDPVIVYLIIFGLFIIASIIIYRLFFKNINPHNNITRLMKYIGPIIWWPIVLIFPFRTYYHLSRVNLDILGVVFFIGVIGGTTMFVIAKLLSFINTRIKK